MGVIERSNLIPFQNEHAARVKAPLPSHSAITRRKQIAPGISIIVQKPSSDPTKPMQIQSYRFSKSKFTADQARNWLKKHKIGTILFEPANE